MLHLAALKRIPHVIPQFSCEFRSFFCRLISSCLFLIFLHITNIPHSVLTGDVNAHSTLWHSYTDDHNGQLIADVIINSDHLTQTHQPRVPNTTLHQTYSPDITTVSNTLYHQTSWTTLNMHYHQTTYPSSPHHHSIRHDYRLQQNRQTFNYMKADWTQFTEDTDSAFAQTTIPINIQTDNIIFTNIILMADKHNIPKGKMHSNCRLLPDHIVSHKETT